VPGVDPALRFPHLGAVGDDLVPEEVDDPACSFWRPIEQPSWR
jgi:hypothetical protein